MKAIESERAKVSERYVFVLDLAAHLGRTGGATASIARRMGLRLVSLRRADTGKAALALVAEDAKRLMAHDTPRAEIVSPADLLKEGA